MSNQSLQIEFREGTFFLDGVINENIDLFEVVKQGAYPVIFDFTKVLRINSYGIKKWIQMLNALDSDSIFYRNCPVFIIDQLNLVQLGVN